ncbi:hypothetical protein NC651_009220 [Populus alba x Populus x berolinensis]|nr:hypothetical protein NC651_009220 [Populus alba x Populus x berolinensis]
MDLERVFSSFGYCVTTSEVGEGIKMRDLLAPKTTDTHVGFRVTDKRATFNVGRKIGFRKLNCGDLFILSPCTPCFSFLLSFAFPFCLTESKEFACGC